MLAFLKRRWLLLSCAFVLLACSLFDHPAGATEGRHGSPMYGLHRGYLFWCVNTTPQTADSIHLYVYKGRRITVFAIPTQSGIRRPMLGHWPWYESRPFLDPLSPTASAATLCSLGVPIWLPLSAVLGWLCFRELRWRETARAPALPSDAGGQSRR